MLSSFSVIVPVLNKENEITRALESVEASIQYFYRHYEGVQPVTAEIVVVNEASSDRTLERVLEFSQDKPHCRVANHGKRVGLGAARNTGVKLAQGEVIFFCDGDDLYFEPHIFLDFQFLNHDPTTSSNTFFTLLTDQGPTVINLPDQVIGMVRTGVFMKDAIHSFWKGAIENTLAHDFSRCPKLNSLIDTIDTTSSSSRDEASSELTTIPGSPNELPHNSHNSSTSVNGLTRLKLPHFWATMILGNYDKQFIRDFSEWG